MLTLYERHVTWREEKRHLMRILALDRNAKIDIPDDARTVILTEV